MIMRFLIAVVGMAAFIFINVCALSISTPPVVLVAMWAAVAAGIFWQRAS
jgi:hypothetical protein